MDINELDALLDASRQPEQTVNVCLRGDLQAEWEKLEQELTTLRAASKATLAGDPEETALAERIRAVEEQMRTATVPMVLRALTRRPWQQLCESHPPRPDNPSDRVVGANTATFYDALIEASVVSPDFGGSDRLKRLLDTLTSMQFDMLASAAWDLNRRDVGVPFSLTASHTIPSSGGTSKRPSGSGSRSNGSLAGNRKR